MAKQLLKLRNVPEDEVAEIYELLESHDVDFYETSAGNWGISMPALWLVDADQYPRVRAILDEYSQQRLERVRAEYETLKQEGKARSFVDMLKENPFKISLYLAIIAVLAYLSIAPFLAIM